MQISNNDQFTWWREWTASVWQEATVAPTLPTNKQHDHPCTSTATAADTGITLLVVSYSHMEYVYAYSSPMCGRLAVYISHISVRDYKTDVWTANRQTDINRYSLESLCMSAMSLWIAKITLDALTEVALYHR